MDPTHPSEMMHSLNRETLTSVFDSAYSFALSNSPLCEKFTELSEAGDGDKIIEIIRAIPDLKNLPIINDQCFHVPKSNDQARFFLKKAQYADKDKTKISYFNKAICAAEIETDDKETFFNTLICPIRWAFTAKHLEKCIQDCRHMISILNNKNCKNFKDSWVYYTYKIECLSYETRCLKILGYTEEARASARNGIREAKIFFQTIKDENKKEENAITEEKKLETLRPFLAVLNENQLSNSEKKCTAAKTDREIMKNRKISVPKVLGKQNNRLQSCSDAVALRYDETKGRHLVATRNIKTGSVLIVDKPFIWSTDKDMLKNNCLHCHESLESIRTIQIPCQKCQTVSSR